MRFFRKPFFKYVSAFVGLNFLVQTLWPTFALALTAGPSQPEMESFEPVGTTQMVDLFSGDFNYNIPLMTVPGPNGGYPINLAYHAGIGMEQEASWVGLGWNINPGVINREMRGLPDDFSGDKVTKTTSMKPQLTYGVYGGSPITTEIFGKDIGGALSFQSYWNSYKGVGTQISLELASKEAGRSQHAPGLNISYSTDGGLGVSPTLAYRHTLGNSELNYHIGFGFNSREGIQSITLGAERHSVKHNSDKTNFMYNGKWGPGGGAGVSFSGGSFVPNITQEMTGTNMRMGIKFGPEATIGTYKYKWLGGFTSQNYLATHETKLPSYGYLYAEGAQPGSNALMDFNREKDVPVNKHSPRLPLPQHTYDVYYVKGQGIGSVFRPYRSDFGMLTDNPMYSSVYGGNLAVEFGFPTTGPIHVGADFGLNSSESYSGAWSESTHWSKINEVKFTKRGSTNSQPNGTNNNPEYEPYYFRAAGEQTAYHSGRDYLLPQGEDPVRFEIDLKFSGLSFKPRVKDELVSDNGTSSVNSKSRVNFRERKVQSLQKRYNWEVATNHNWQVNGSSGNTKHLYTINEFPGQPSVTGTAFDYTFNNFTYSSTGTKNHHIGEITAINPDGNKYVYGIPVYNVSQKEVCFSVDNPLTDLGDVDNSDLKRKKAIYTASGNADNSYKNTKGFDNYFNSTELPPYAHSYLLTQIVSPDYVDLTGNGPSEDDLGYYVKFNYSVANSSSNAYRWRIPYDSANSIKGHLSDLKDDKASYVYGNKEIYILNSIETKTHIATFLISGDKLEGNYIKQRPDGFGVNSENNFDLATAQSSNTAFKNSQCSFLLREIKLYSKKDLTNPIKTTHFEYNWDLCGNTENNIGTTFDPNSYNWSTSSYGSDNNLNYNKGKLTLKKVWFSYFNNKVGKLSPYVFDYRENNLIYRENPSYSVMQMDRWGNYKPDNWTDGVTNEDNPYTDQSSDYNHDGTVNDGIVNTSTADVTARNEDASSWCLKKITLPSGGVIDIGYEQDNYRYVQDKPAAEMYRIIGIKTKTGIYMDPCSTSTAYSNTKSGRVYFEFSRPVKSTDTAATMTKIVNGIDKVYFKAFMKLKVDAGTNDTAYDYVSGYANLDKTVGTYHVDPTSNFTSNGSTFYRLGFVTLKPEATNDLGGGLQIHPIRKAAWQYLRWQRNDLMDQPAEPVFGAGNAQDFLPVLDLLRSSVQLLTNYYGYAILNNWCRRIVNVPADDINISHSTYPNYYKPSFIRLNCSGDKYGGGHRVKSITVTDKWSGMDASQSDFDYGQEFTYTMPDGTSSGVAEYEPLVGGDEIPQRLPVKYSSDRFLLKDNALYTEEPYGESYFPSANVGYRRVTVRDKKRTDGSGNEINKTTQTGFSVSEFYTARDFPVRTAQTDVDQAKYPFTILIPFVGTFSFNNRGYSQGYKIELNDMHGKPRSVAAYSSNSALTTPLSKVEYIYNTVNTYNPDAPETSPNKLKSEVNILSQEGYYTAGTLGRTSDFFIDMRENSDVSFDQQRQLNVDALPPYPIFGWAIPEMTYGEAMFRSIVTTKVIHKCGILTETRNYQDGSMVKTKNLLFDSETGAPLLSQVTNEYNRDIFNYSLPAYWAYNNMGPAYKNIGLRLYDFALSSGVLTTTMISDLNDYFNLGDKIELVTINGSSTVRKPYWVSAINSLGVNLNLIDEAGGNPPNHSASASDNFYLEVMESGRRNLQSIMTGTISGLNDPTLGANRLFPLFTEYNAYLDANNPTTSFSLTGYVDCNTAVGATVTASLSGRVLTLTKSSNSATVTFPAGILTGYSDLDNYRLKKAGSKVIATHITTNAALECKWSDPNNTFPMCLEKVLNASAIQFKDTWTYDYNDVGNPTAKYLPNGSSSYTTSNIVTASGLNAYRYGAANVWRTQKSNAYLTDRLQSTSADVNPHTDLSRDGTFKDFVLFDWTATTNSKWTWVNEITRYSPYGFETENKDALNNYSAALYAYDNTSVIGVAKNAEYFETVFDGFEDYGGTYGSAGHGHLNLTGASLLNTSSAHTGNYVTSLGSSATISTTATINASSPLSYFTPKNNKQYVIISWFKATSGTPTVSVTGGGVTGVSTTVGAEKIEGWQRVETVFTTGASGTITITMGFGSGSGYIDDIRIQPFKCAMKTYVYNPTTLWLIAEHDERGYATFYNYDEEGTLVQVKKETVNGIMTLKTTRQNLKR